ncbi:polysaccharide pyruvyl transferase family protein [Myceligenerans pegani]|uniref:Polysaccharide pyruvyl transferase family protein n=1 Tax=Myceligenerans pegani TaxID=2776917 RepID=A0ABR9MY94_9MICO|nr:polysaccharide pyruvyl transferase family protein [Myceligenerans sp. TRM 65318]MBE1876363.1 polysaccharide pyruvyl transferase family protein [Myceligenerans sp. TRM 65318]MBE3018634.1 polysaccharide pyruvyl transferase family protein [Myceligenerans sp. TRM 65318]
MTTDTTTPDQNIAVESETTTETELAEHRAEAPRNDVIVCSFYTADDYYRGHGERLRAVLDRLGVAHELREIEIPEGLDWADVTRRKVPFLAEVCEKHPDKKVYWIDVDCSLSSFPPLIADFSADIIGFQRGFSSPLSIGYANRTRFWEPAFWGVNTSPAARRFVADAAAAEAAGRGIKATDDYFFEESWRKNAESLSFQIIPSVAVFSKAKPEITDVTPFFSFGSSGNVEEFKGKVVQHGRAGLPGGSASAGVPMRRRVLDVLKKVERKLPGDARNSLRLVADRVGVTHVLTHGLKEGFSGSGRRIRIANRLVREGQAGRADKVAELWSRLERMGPVDDAERDAKRAADTFVHFRTTGEGTPIPLAWWPRPYPGNFGDWLSPLVLAHYSGRPLRFLEPAAPVSRPHILSVGSIGRFVKPKSVVVGTGISSDDISLEPKATYVSLRGPITAERVRESGGPEVTSFGDPGLLLSRIYPHERGETNGRVALVRHFTHANLPVVLPEGWDELSVLMSSPEDIETFTAHLVGYDAVVTSAMHVMIACHSYGIPCALVVFEGMEGTVHGNGVKYRDYSLGAGLSRTFEPVSVPLDLNAADLPELVVTERVSEAKLDEVAAAVRTAVDTWAARAAR